MSLELVRDISELECAPDHWSEDSYRCKSCDARIEPTWEHITAGMFDLHICALSDCLDRRAAQLAMTEERYEGAQRDLATYGAALIEMLALSIAYELPHASEDALPVEVQLTESLRLALAAVNKTGIMARRALIDVRSGHARRAEFQQAAVIAVALAGAR